MQKEQLENSIKRGFKFGDMRFIRIFDLNLIPRRLIEEVAGRRGDVNVKNVYDFNEALMANPFNIFYAIANKDNKVIGVQWIMINPLDDSLWSQITSVDKEYQNTGISDFIVEKLIELRDALGLKKIKAITTRPRALGKLGFKKSRNILMEV